MILTQTAAMLVDSYRELNNKKLFWITLGLSGGAMGLFGLVGVTEHSVTFMGNPWFASEFPVLSYKGMFSFFVVGIWLTWAATILALISTAFIFPDFLTAGSVDLYLAKPMSRARLFLTKYVAGLLFVALQVAAFCAVAFLVLGIRGGVWLPSIFMAVPIITLFFSYLYCIQVLVGVWTRSTIASILLTLLVWLGFMGINRVESYLHADRAICKLELQDIEMINKLMDTRIVQLESIKAETVPSTAGMVPATTQAAATTVPTTSNASTTTAATNPTTSPAAELEKLKAQRSILAEEKTKKSAKLAFDEQWESITWRVKTFIPKTNDTVDLLDNFLIRTDDFESKSEKEPNLDDSQLLRDVRAERLKNTREAVSEIRDRPLWWILGTSLLFEAVVVGIAGWLFCRRDY